MKSIKETQKNKPLGKKILLAMLAVVGTMLLLALGIFAFTMHMIELIKIAIIAQVN